MLFVTLSLVKLLELTIVINKEPKPTMNDPEDTESQYLEIIIHSDYWLTKHEKSHWQNICEKCITTLQEIKVIKLNQTINLALADDTFLKSLNFQFRSMNKPTNVLSFPNLEDTYDQMIASKASIPAHLGDIAISFETLEKEALERKILFDNHFSHLFLHGFLHLLGYTHDNDTDAEAMESLESKVLEKMHITSPYIEVRHEAS